ncbi:RNA-binding protein 8A [Coemansia javaensis]|uniref:RNA-binding protein 8A n=1 Tax=Coemansia javaensis TaxID=2761396 RepID=A0A9W8HGH8_9FUNG|nr:RNA-binding protein 8A [Coemansia javaensis]
MADKVISIAGSASKQAAPEEAVPPGSAMEVESEPAAVAIAGCAPRQVEQDATTEPAPRLDSSAVAQRSVEGWVVVATGVHEEAREEDVQDFFADYGRVRNLHLNLDRQTGYVKGYALVEYDQQDEARAAVQQGSGRRLLGKPLVVDFAFVASSAESAARGGERFARRDERDGGYGRGGDRYVPRADRYGRRHSRSPRRSAERSREQSPDVGF